MDCDELFMRSLECYFGVLNTNMTYRERINSSQREYIHHSIYALVEPTDEHLPCWFQKYVYDVPVVWQFLVVYFLLALYNWP